MAETTPGPFISVVQVVSFIADFHQPDAKMIRKDDVSVSYPARIQPSVSAGEGSSACSQKSSRSMPTGSCSRSRSFPASGPLVAPPFDGSDARVASFQGQLMATLAGCGAAGILINYLGLIR